MLWKCVLENEKLKIGFGMPSEVQSPYSVKDPTFSLLK